LASQSSAGQEIAIIEVEPPPLPTIRGESAEESLESAESREGIQRQSPLGLEEEFQTPSASPTALEPIAFSSTESDQAAQSSGSSVGELMGSPHVERVPENIVVAKVQPSGAIEEQLARIKEDELATATAGLQDVFFEFDSWKITEVGKDVLDTNANWLQEESAMNLLIEGHCDQRGTQAYNIVLGKKRAIAIREYLVQLGIEPIRLSVITYGKEKPFCTDQTEFCFKENRRGHILVQKP